MSGVTAPAFQVVISLKLIVDAKFKIFYHYLISCQESFSLVGLESSKNVYFVTILNSKCPGKLAIGGDQTENLTFQHQNFEMREKNFECPC